MLSGDLNDFNKQRAVLLLLALVISIDLAFIALHSINEFSPLLNNRLYSLEKDLGFAEMYQYVKWFWIILLLTYTSITRRSFCFIAWVLVFSYFLLDDALSLHETVGLLISRNLGITPILGLRPEDYGELAVSAAVGLLLLSFVTWAYVKGGQAFRKMSRDLLLLILILAFFGVVVDMVHVVSYQSDLDMTSFFLAVLEDGGEMIVGSLIFCYLFLVAITRDQVASAP